MHTLMHGDLISWSYLPYLASISQTTDVAYEAGLHCLQHGTAWSSVGTSGLDILTKDEFHKPTDYFKLKKSWLGTL